MKANWKKKLVIDLTLDSSEAIMFNQGGMHKIALDPEIFLGLDEEDSIEISVQMSRNEQGRFDFIVGESMKPKG